MPNQVRRARAGPGSETLSHRQPSEMAWLQAFILKKEKEKLGYIVKWCVPVTGLSRLNRIAWKSTGCQCWLPWHPDSDAPLAP